MFHPSFQTGNGLQIVTSSTVQDIDAFGGTTSKKTQNLVILHKNARGLSRDDDITEILAELETIEWDFVSLNETMRTSKTEHWIAQGGHRFMGSGHDLPTRGVGFLVHKKWSSSIKQFRRISERLAFIDIHCRHFKMRFVTAYFPHSGYADEDVQKLYDELSQLQWEAKQRKMVFIIGADCNAEVGSTDESTITLGKFGLGETNSRGRWLTSWATVQNLVIANTHFEKPANKLSTFTSPNGRQRQIDYFLVDRRVRGALRDCEATSEVHIDSDHKALKMRLHLESISRKRPTKKKKQNNLKRSRWPPTCIDTYKAGLSHRLEGFSTHEGTVSCDDIEMALTETMAECEQPTERISRPSSVNLQTLLQQRRDTPSSDQEARRLLTKKIRKEIRDARRSERRTKIGNILNEYKNLKAISGIKSQKQKELIPCMISKNGSEVHERQGIADTFADFYEDLYGDASRAPNLQYHEVQRGIESFTWEEMETAIRMLKKGKAPDNANVCAEMIKYGGEKVQNTLLSTFNKILEADTPTPESWRRTIIKVLHKSGDSKLPQNYRPIASIPILYKLFSRLIYNRLVKILDSQQNMDQAGFRRGKSTTDHLYTIVMVQEIADEWKFPIWTAAVDFKKAFDSVTHRALWYALSEQGVSDGYIHLLDKLYTKQVGVVKTDRFSRKFNIEKGVKQGDPLSSLLFNSASEHIMRKLKDKWRRNGHGITLKPREENLTNLRFADDILLITRSLESMTEMIADLSAEARHIGLQLHPDKTKILHNSWTKTKHQRIPTMVNAGGMQIDVLTIEGSTKYLGRQLSFSEPHQTEIENRIALAWKKFYAQKQELTCRVYSINDRLRLFHGTVTPTILYGSEAWTMTKELERRLQTTQRKMLRMIIQIPRRMIQEPDSEESESTSHQSNMQRPDEFSEESLEPWHEWIQRSTHEAEQRMQKLQMKDWVHIQRQRKWRWAGKIATKAQDSWILRALTWDPSPHMGVLKSRNVGRPKMRWTDDIKQYLWLQLHQTTPLPSINPRLDNSWLHHAEDEIKWKQLEEGYVARPV